MLKQLTTPIHAKIGAGKNLQKLTPFCLKRVEVSNYTSVLY